MSDDKLNFQSRIDVLGYHLGLLDEAEAARVEASFGSPVELEKLCSRISRTLAPLDADEFAPPMSLADRILAKVGEPTILPFPKVAATADVAQGGRAGGFLAMRELIAMAAAIVLFVGIFVPGYRTARNSAQQIACLNNMRTISAGYASYAETYSGHLPFAGPTPADAQWCLTDNGYQQCVNNSRHAYLLVSGRLVPASSFYCPARPGDFPYQGDDADLLRNFPDARNASFAPNYMTSPWKQGALQPVMPLLGDMNPLVDENRRLYQGIPPANSTSHGRPGGQNVLRLDGSAGFFKSPNVGVDKDDIYRLLGVERYKGSEQPSSPTDAFLVP